MTPPSFTPRPIVLAGSYAVLEPLHERHAVDLFAAGGDAATWAYMPRPPLKSVDDAASMIRQALAATEAGDEVAFAIVDAASARAGGGRPSTPNASSSSCGTRSRTLARTA